ADHAHEIADSWLRSSREAPTPADLYELGARIPFAEPAEPVERFELTPPASTGPKPCNCQGMGCMYCRGTGYRLSDRALIERDTCTWCYGTGTRYSTGQKCIACGGD